MGFVDQVDNELQKIVANKSKRKKKDQESGFVQQVDQEIAKMGYAPDDDIAPVFTPGPVRTVDSSSISDRMTTKKDEDKGLDFFQKGVFEDGYNFGDVTKAILGTAGDVGLNVVKGVGGLLEGVVDLADYGIAAGADALGYDDYADSLRKTTASSMVDKLTSGADEYLDKYSVLGRTSDSVMQGIGQVGGIMLTGGLGAGAGLSAAGVTALTSGVMGLSGMGSGMGEAYQSGANDLQALKHGLNSGAADAVSELIFGGLGKTINALGFSRGLSSADDILAKVVGSKFKNQAARNIVEFGIKSGAEGLEEVIAGVAQAYSKYNTYLKDQGVEFADVLKDENLLEQFLVGSFTSGIAQGSGLHMANKTKTDFITGQSQNEQAVIKKEIENRIAAAEKDGKKLTAQEKSAIEAQVEKDLEKGYISTDTIEEVLGGESYSAYSNLMKEAEEFNTLYKTEGGKLSEEQRDRLAELKEKNKANPYQTQIQTAKEKLSQDVFGIAKSDRLVESYNERARRGQAFEADLSKYDKKQQQTIQNAINSGLLNNTNRTHELVDFIAKISADKGVLFDFTNNEKIKGTQFAVEGKIVNGYVTESGVTLNVESPKYLNTTVGHEITHVLEGTEFYDTLRETIFNYAIAKDGQDAFNARLKEIESLYKGMKDTTAEAELTADLVGEYLFTDSDFIQRLSTENRNVFQKIYDEIKYLCRVATAGSKEARELERVKKAFEDAYRAEGKQTNTQHSLSDNTGRQLTKGQQEYFKDSKMRDDNGNLMVMYHGSQDAGFHVFDSSFSDDDTSFFFVDRNDVAASYSGTSETYEAKTIRTAEDMNNFLAEIGYDQYEAIEQDGKFELLEDGDHVAYSDTAQGLYEEFCWYEGVGNGDANYKVYLNLKNPLVVDADGRNWDNVSREFSQEVADKYHSLTAEEKEALTNIAEWGEISIFRDEIRSATDGALASAYEKLGKDINMYDLFSIAEDNFSEESIEAWAVKQMNTRDYAQKAKAEGYDGVIFENIHDNGGYSNGSEGASTVAIAFDSNQIKSTANENPTADKDIRYSISEEQNQRGLNTEQEFQYSLSRDTEFSDNAIKKNEANKKSNHYSIDSEVLAEAKQLREAVAARMREIKEMGHVGMPEDTEGKTDIANSSYDVTEENTTICPRSLASEAFVDAVSEYLGRPLTVEEQIYISQDLLKPGRTLTPECTYCYVATDRKAYRAFLGEYINQRDAVLQKLKENPDIDISQLHKDHLELKADPKAEVSPIGELYREFLNGRKVTDPMYKRFKMWADAYKNGRPMVEASHLANMEKLMGDIKSEFGAELKPQIVDAMKYAQSASWAKKRVSYVAYNGHILKWKQDRINKLNSHYGLRMYSFSDFHPAFVLENMQMITDASVRGLKMLGYTKDTDFVEIFAPSGMNINISTFGGVRNGTVFEDSMMGANWQKAKALRMQYPNVGITFVATNDTMVEWALAQDWIDVVIPYHLVRTGEKVAAAFNYTNYTQESSDKKGKDWQKGKDEKYIAPTKHNNDLETYLNALADNHLEPRFARFIDNPNYMKLVNECRQSASESKPVQPKFNEDAINEVLAKLATNGYYQPIGGSVDRMYEIAAEVAESMTHQLAPAMSLSNIGDQPKTYGTYNVSGKDVALEAAPVAETAVPVTEAVAETPVAPVRAEPEEDLFPDDLAPVQDELDELYQQKESLEGRMVEAINAEDVDALTQANIAYDAVMGRIEHLEKPDAERTASLEDADVPPEMEAPLSEESENYNPFGGITHDEITRSTRSYSDRNPGARHFFEEAALGFLYDVNNSTHGERWYNDELYYRTGGEEGFGGTSRHTTDDIAELKDTYGYTWDELRKAAEAVADGDFRTVAAKRVEYLLNKRMLEGYTDVDGRRYDPNQEYISYLNETFANEQRSGSVGDLLENAGQYAPMEDIAPMKPTETVNTDSKKGVIRGQETYITAEDKLNGRRPQEGTGDAPLYDSKEKSAVHGQQTMFEPPKPNPRVATVLTEETAIAKEKTGISGKLVSALVDKGMVFENLSLKTGNHELQSKWNYALGFNTEARAQHLMENGDAGVKSLKDIKTTVDKSGKADAFFNYLYHVHNIDRMTLDERFGVENKTVFGETVTADVSRKKAAQYEKANPEFKVWAEDVYGYNKHLRQMLVDGGVISQETADLWEKMYPHYVPIRRVDSKGQNISVPLDTNKTGVNNPVKKATGGSSDIQPVFSTMAQRTEQTYRAIARNSFGIELKNTLGSTINSQQNTTSVDETIDTLVAQEDHLLKAGTMSSNPTFTVFENGERVEFEITEDMFDALKPAGGILGHRNKAIGAVGNVRRNLLTTWNPVFALYRNPIKDMQDVAINSQHAVKTYLNVPNAIYEIATGGKWATEYHRNGGKSNTYFDSRANQFKADDNAFKKAIGMPLRAIENAGEFIEEIPRLAEYIASRKEGRSEERSMLDAARVTTNFAAGGDFTKFLNSHGFTFLNASVQGASQHVRNFREAKQEGLKGYTKVLAKYVIAGLPTILLNSMLWDDDEEYEELSDYVKQNYYVVAKTKEGKFVRIPKGRTAAVMGELMKQMQNLVTGNDVADFNTFFELFMNNIAPSNPVENNIIAPIWQASKNTAWYGGDLVPSRLQDLPAEEQFDESTDSISKWLGENFDPFDLGPYKINYLLDQYSGGLGDMVLPMLTPEAESGDNSFMGNVLAPWKKEITTDSVLNNKNPGNFYDLRDELKVKSNSRKATEEDKMRTVYMDSVSWDMSDLYAKKREVQGSDLPDAEKYETVREIQEEINALARAAMEGYNNVSIDGIYSEVGDRRYNYSSEKGKWYEITPENSDGTANWFYQQEQKVTKAFGISYGEYWNNKEEYDFAYDKPDQYALSKVTGGYNSYRSYTSDLWDIKADKDENGKSISGSKKDKIYDYINSQDDLDYGERIIMFKMNYPADDSYNYEIIKYLNSRDNMTYEEMETILKGLGFEVDSEGNISW